MIVDRLSKFAHFLPLSHPFMVKQVAKAFLENIYKLYGLPKTIVCDRDPVFVSHFWQELFCLHRVNFNMSSYYHPQIDGQSEAVNRCLEMYLLCFSRNSPKSWSSWLP